MLLQSAANQEGGLDKKTKQYARLLKYNVSNPREAPRYAREFVVPLALWTDPTAKPSKNPKVAGQSEIFHIQDGKFLVLARDSGSGHGQSSTLSIYRHVDIFDIDSATDVKGAAYDCTTCRIAGVDGILKPEITPVAYGSFLDFNANAQLGRFGLHHGGAQDQMLLNEKWESIALVPVDGGHDESDSNNEEYFLFSLSDNDFVTRQGFLNFGTFPYEDASGYNLGSQALAFKVQLPKDSKPFG